MGDAKNIVSALSGSLNQSGYRIRSGHKWRALPTTFGEGQLLNHDLDTISVFPKNILSSPKLLITGTETFFISRTE